MSQRSETRFRDYVCRDCGEKFTKFEVSDPMYVLQDIFSPSVKCPKCGSKQVESATGALARKVVERYLRGRF